MTDLGQLSWFLGIKFECKHDRIKMNQSKYIERILSKFNMENCKTRQTPCEMNFNKISDDKVELIDDKLYREIVGSLIYVMIATRPDICYTVTKLSQDLAKPTTVHWKRAKQVLRYLKGTKDQSLVFRKSLKN